MKQHYHKRLGAALLAMALLAGASGCDRGEVPAGASADAPALPTAQHSSDAPDTTTRIPERVVLEDVVEVDSDYVVGITYPASAMRYPALAAELKRYAEAARAELMRAVEGRRSAGGAEGDAAMYDLSISFSEILSTPSVVAYAADGSTYTGGAHGMPLLARFVWLPGHEQLLTSERLVPAQGGWESIAGHVRERLQSDLEQRVEGDGLPPEQRREVVQNATAMIDDGTVADPDNFAQFEPVADDDGRVRALRFVFPPYQVGPYSDGTQTVEIPAEVVLPHVAPEYRSLFEGSGADTMTAQASANGTA